jgi:hypothetical protein
MPHQTEAAGKIAASRFLGIWAKPRTGKTLATLMGQAEHDTFPLLIICPLQIMASWLTELLDFGYKREDIQLVRPVRTTDRMKTVKQQLLYDKKIFMVTYSTLEVLDALYIRDYSAITPFSPRKAPRWMKLPNWQHIIADESYCIGNYEAGVTQYCLKHSPPFYQVRNCLSGSPASESLLNFATQYLFMAGHYMGCTTYDAYLRKYWGYDRDTHTRYMLDPSHQKAVFDYVHEHGFCKESLLKDAPVRIQTVDLNDRQLAILQWLNITTTYLDRKGVEKLMYPVVRAGMEERTAVGIHPISQEVINTAKIDQALAILTDPTESALIVTHYTALYGPMMEALHKAGRPCRMITSKMKREEREANRVWFQETPGACLVGQSKICARGLDFSALAHLIHISWSMSQETWEQINDRGKHPSRTDMYNVWALCTHDTSDRKRIQALGVKKYNSSAAIKELRHEIAADIVKPGRYDR